MCLAGTPGLIARVVATDIKRLARFVLHDHHSIAATLEAAQRLLSMRREVNRRLRSKGQHLDMRAGPRSSLLPEVADAVQRSLATPAANREKGFATKGVVLMISGNIIDIECTHGYHSNYPWILQSRFLSVAGSGTCNNVENALQIHEIVTKSRTRCRFRN